jgi:hypothetical protein
MVVDGYVWTGFPGLMWRCGLRQIGRGHCGTGRVPDPPTATRSLSVATLRRRTILPGHALDQHDNRVIDGQPTDAVGYVHFLPPGEMPATGRGQKPGQRANEGAVCPGRTRTGDLPTQDTQLMAQHQNLRGLGCF